MKRQRWGFLKTNRSRTLFGNLRYGTAEKKATEATVFDTKVEAEVSRRNYRGSDGHYYNLDTVIPVTITIEERTD